MRGDSREMGGRFGRTFLRLLPSVVGASEAIAEDSGGVGSEAWEAVELTPMVAFPLATQAKDIGRRGCTLRMANIV